MKTYFAIFTLLFAMTGCDSPQRSRMPSTYVSNPYSSGNPATGTLSGGATTSGTTTGSPTTPTTPTSPGFESCNLGDRFQTIDIGFFGLCQSTQDETQFKFKTSLSHTSVRICLIPTYKSSDGSSTYIGQPQCTYTTSGQIISGKLYKDRSGFTTSPLNGVIVMKESLLKEYFSCMQAYVNWPRNVCATGATTAYCAYWLPRCPYGSGSNAGCDNEGRNYMTNLCTNFKSKYANSYIDISLK